MKYSRFVALSQKEVSSSDIDRGVGVSTCTKKYSEEREHGHSSRPCEPHICLIYGHTCYETIDPSGQHSFMEEVSILTLSMFFIFIYLFCIMCIYIDFLLYDVLQLLRSSSIPFTPMDASAPSPYIDVTVEAACSLGTPHTQVCVTFDKLTIVIYLFDGILKILMFLCFYRIWEYAMVGNVHLGWKSHLHHSYHVYS
jgi:hypothetical protein